MFIQGGSAANTGLALKLPGNLPGVTIGDNSVIGAGSVVTKDIPANVVAFGSPCHVYREINERDDEYYFRDHRFDEQPERDGETPVLDFLNE